jgi:hypothetical protein
MAAGLGDGAGTTATLGGGGRSLTATRRVAGLHPSRSWVVGGTTHEREPISSVGFPGQALARPRETTLPAIRTAVARSFGFSPIASTAAA